MILKSGTYDTDIASLKLGVDGLSLFIPNGWGDGCWDWFLVDSSDDIPEGAEDGLCFQGQSVMVFNSEYADGLPVAGPFSGSFMAHALNGDIYIEIISGSQPEHP